MTLTQRLTLWHRLTQTSYFLLIAILVLWAYIYPSETFSSHLVALVWVLPLLFPMRGILKRQFYTYAWAQFLNMLYFCHATVYMMTSKTEFIIATIELLLVLLFFSASIVAIQIKKKIIAQES